MAAPGAALGRRCSFVDFRCASAAGDAAVRAFAAKTHLALRALRPTSFWGAAGQSVSPANPGRRWRRMRRGMHMSCSFRVLFLSRHSFTKVDHVCCSAKQITSRRYSRLPDSPTSRPRPKIAAEFEPRRRESAVSGALTQEWPLKASVKRRRSGAATATEALQHAEEGGGAARPLAMRGALAYRA